MKQIEVDSRLTNQHIFTKITKQNQFSTNGESLYLWSGLYWQRVEKEAEHLVIRRCFTAETQASISTRRIQEIVGLIKECPELQLQNEDISEGIIQFQNGSFDVEQQALQEGKIEEKRKVAVIKADYIPNTRLEDTKHFFAFCKSSLDYEVNPQKTKLLLQILGYALSGCTRAKKAFFFVGAPSSGKSVVLHLVKAVLPEEDITQIPFAGLSSRFNIGQLRNSRVNLCSELEEKGFPSISIFKAVVSGDELSGENKGENIFKFTPKVKLLNAGNVLSMPKNADGTLSVIDRMVVLLFNHSIPREQWDTKLLEKLIAEKDIICSLAVDTLKELVDSNFQFVEPEDSREYIKNYSEALDSVNTFVCEDCQLDEDYTVGSVELWNRYREYCGNNMFQNSISQQVFVNKILEISGVKKERVRIGGSQQTIFKGIKFGQTEESTEPRLGAGGQSVTTEKHPAHPERGKVVFPSNFGRVAK